MSIANTVPWNELESGERVGDRLYGNFKGLVSVSLCNWSCSPQKKSHCPILNSFT
jgi:hypothetical protein